MNSKAKKADAKKAAAKAVSGSYNVKEAISIARKNGSALRVVTAKASGNYEISSTSKAGTPIVLRKIFRDNFPKVKSVSATNFNEAINAILSDPSGIANLSKHVSKEKGKEYNNAKTLLRRIRTNISEGSILRFSLSD